jgi:hypothetical protein
MTICERVGTFQTELFCRSLLNIKSYKTEFVVDWVSSGHYSIKFDVEQEIGPLGNIDNLYKDCYINLAPEWIQKTLELYPTAELQPRDKCYKPFYEDFHTDRCMFDFGFDRLFQAFKCQFDDKVILTTYHFIYGIPTGEVSVLYMAFEEFKRFKEFLDNAIKPFYSGVRFGETGVEKIWAGTDCEPQQRDKW